MAELPVPLTPADADLKPFKDMPFEVGRFATSGLITHEEPEAIVAAILLWGAAWHQLPAGSLPDNDRELANLAGYGRAVSAWVAVKKGALRGWIKCSDGRLYHEVVAEKVRESWLARLKQMWRNYGSAIRNHNSKNPDDVRHSLPFEDWNESGRPEGIGRKKPPRQEEMSLEKAPEVARNDKDDCAQPDGEFARKNDPKGREGNRRDRKGRESLVVAAAREPPHDWKIEELADVFEVVSTVNAAGGTPPTGACRGDDECDQHRDDAEHDEEFEDGEPAS